MKFCRHYFTDIRQVCRHCRHHFTDIPQQFVVILCNHWVIVFFFQFLFPLSLLLLRLLLLLLLLLLLINDLLERFRFLFFVGYLSLWWRLFSLLFDSEDMTIVLQLYTNQNASLVPIMHLVFHDALGYSWYISDSHDAFRFTRNARGFLLASVRLRCADERLYPKWSSERWVWCIF